MALFKNVTNQSCSLDDLDYKATFHTPLGLPVVLNKPQYDRAINCLPIEVYFKTDTTDKQIAAFLSKLKSKQTVYKVDYVSKQQAVENYKKSIQSSPIFLEIMPKGNFLPASANVYVNFKKNRDQIASELKTNPLIDTVIIPRN